MKSRHKGFSLIEVLVAITICSIFFGGVAVNQSYEAEYLRKLEFTKNVIDINEALATYLFFHNSEPLSQITVEMLIQKGFLIGENKSPWGTPCKIIITEKNGTVVETKDYKGRKVQI